ncbi:MAG TPA: hypothetical protein VIJ38_00980 [Acidobacteriaceae bacterium]
MAAKNKKKSTGGNAPIRKALAGMEKAQRELELNIRNLKAAMGHIHKASGGTGQGHIHAASGKGHVHSAKSGMAKGHVHSATSGKAKGHVHSA